MSLAGMISTSHLRSFKIIVACTTDYGIGINGSLPFRLKSDMAFFKETTMTTTQRPNSRNAVIMGRKTWESIPTRFKPLEKRLNVIITTNLNYDVPEGVLCFDSIYKALDALSMSDYETSIEEVFIIGGASLYSKCLAEDVLLRSLCKAIYFTRVFSSIHCDVFFPKEPFETYFYEDIAKRRRIEEDQFVYDIGYYLPI